VHNGPLAGLVAVCAGSDLMHPLGALVTGAVAGGAVRLMFTLTQNRWKIDDVLGVWPLHGLCGTWGGIAAGIFGLPGARRPRRRELHVAAHRHAAGVAIALVGGLRSTAQSSAPQASASTRNRNTKAPTSPSTSGISFDQRFDPSAKHCGDRKGR
jgi:ammonia channel protein AmtB